ncbi:RNA-directed DNA polymerase, eukaryota [Tanacetum coccineum]
MAARFRKACQGYGNVVDVFIPNRKSKAEKRFAFVRFIKVVDVDRLVGNLCTLWIGRMHLHANVVRFECSPIHSSRPINPIRSGNIGAPSFASALKGKPNISLPIPSSPAMVLDDSCVVKHNLDNYVMGEVKNFSSINNLRVLLSNERFQNVKLTYLGGLWVMIKLESAKTKTKFMQHVGIASWFSRLCNAQSDFVSRERIAWVDIEGVPLHAWSHPTFNKIGSRWGEVMDLEECKDDCFARKRICIKTKQEDNILEKFKIIIKGNFFVLRAKELFVWSLMFKDITDIVYCSDDESIKGADVNNVDTSKQVNLEAESDVEGVSDTYFGEHDDNLGNEQDLIQSPNEKEISSDPFNIYDLLKKHDKGEANSGFDTSTDQAKSQSRYEGLSSRILEDAQPLDEHLSSEIRDIGHEHKKGGSILEVLDDMIKVGQTMGFSMDGCLGSKAKKDWIRELNIKHKVNFLTLQETKMDYISNMDVKLLWGNYKFDHIISETVGDCMVMGDFNEVRCVEDRMGSVFNVQGANEFNNFISNSRLVEVQSEGICLDRHLSDHRPILLREVVTDYRATLFRIWVYQRYSSLKLSDIDKVLDQGGANEEILLFRLDLLKQMQDIKSSDALDFMQKAKIRSAIEEMKSKFFMYHQSKNLSWRIRTRDEIRNAVWGCGENKSPGQNGSTLIFCPRNSSFVALIPKIHDPKFVSDYRPISLIGSLYKVVTKVLATRLSMVIFDLISDVQTAFLPNRQILDGPFIINELLFWCKHKKQQAMVFKVDFAKAYDYIRWDYLDDVLRSFGFGSKWCSWISGSLKSRMALVLINGSPTSEFQFHCGLKQGDPLALYLFILIMESLHLSFSRVVDAGIFTGIKIDSSLTISHLFYADDAVFIDEWSNANLSGIMHILHCFLLSSGLKINLKKSHLLGVGTSNDSIIAAALKLGCSVMKTPFKYLRVMVGGNSSTIKAWDDTLGKLKARLSNWKLKTLSVGRKLTYLKSVLMIPLLFSNMPFTRAAGRGFLRNVVVLMELQEPTASFRSNSRKELEDA